MQQIAIVVDIFPGFLVLPDQTFDRSLFRPAHHGLDASPPTRHDRAVWLSTLDRGLDSSIYTHGRRQSTTARHQTSTTSSFEQQPIACSNDSGYSSSNSIDCPIHSSYYRSNARYCTNGIRANALLHARTALTARPFELQQVERPTLHEWHSSYCLTTRSNSSDCPPIRATQVERLHQHERHSC